MADQRQPRHRGRSIGASRYRGGTAPTWRECRLIDISSSAAAFEPFDLEPAEQLEGTVLLDIVSGSDATRFQLRGEVRHVMQSSLGATRIGIEFVALTPEDHERLEIQFPLDDTF